MVYVFTPIAVTYEWTHFQELIVKQSVCNRTSDFVQKKFLSTVALFYHKPYKMQKLK